MTDNLKKFLEIVSKDEALQTKLNEKPEEAVKTAIVLAAEHGITLTEADFEAKKPAEGAMTDDELDAVAGGACGCALAGGGGGKNWLGNTYGCACAIYGQGGDGKDVHMNCLCGGSGFGNDGDFFYS